MRQRVPATQSVSEKQTFVHCLATESQNALAQSPFELQVLPVRPAPVGAAVHAATIAVVPTAAVT